MKKKSNLEFLAEAKSKLPVLKSFPFLDRLVATMKDDTTTTKMLAELDAELDDMCRQDIDLSIDVGDTLEPTTATQPLPAPVCASGSAPTTIRIHNSVKAAFKVQAKKLGIPYQRLINNTLKSAMADWATPAHSHL